MKFAKNDGFTLVELIVVIAILAILAGAAVPAYGAYLDKANQSADIALVGEVIHALELGYYSGINTEEGFVVLSRDSGPSVVGNTISSTALENSLKEAFGEDLSGLMLKYDSWNVEYKGSSYQGNEAALLNQVDKLSNTLAGAITTDPSVVGKSFGTYLEQNGLKDASADKQADAAALYIAQNTTNISDANRQQYLTAITDFTKGPKQSAAKITSSFGGVSGVAALYAFAEGYFQYEKANNPNSTGLDTIHAAFDGKEIADSEAAANELMAAISTAMNNADPELSKKYFAGGMDSLAVKDAEAYLDIMETVNSANNKVMDEIKGGKGFSSSDVISDLMSKYSNGAVIIVVEQNEDGTLNILNPLEAE